MPEVAIGLEGRAEGTDDHADRRGQRGELRAKQDETSGRLPDPAFEQRITEEAMRHEPGHGEHAQVGHRQADADRNDSCRVADRALLAQRVLPDVRRCWAFSR